METTQYNGELTADRAAAAMQAARLKSIDLLESAELLFEARRFAHCVSLSILSIEESGKLPLLQIIFLTPTSELPSLWQRYRQHRAKTVTLSTAIESQIRVQFPEVGADAAKEVAAEGPLPDELESLKQRAIYSDCFAVGTDVVCHLPRNVDWEQVAWERLCEARAVVRAPRDRSPEELTIWKTHTDRARASGKGLADALPAIHQDLLEGGFIKEGWWDTILADLKANQGDG